MNQRRARGGTKSFGRFWDKLRGNPPRTRGGNPLVVVGMREAKPNVAPSGRQTMEIRRASPIGAQGGSPPAAPRGQRQGWTSRGRTSRQAPSAKCAAETEGFGGKVAEGNGEAAHKRPRRDVKRREEKPRRERRRVGSRSLGGRRGTNANRNNATDGQTPEKRLCPTAKTARSKAGVSPRTRQQLERNNL